MNHYKESAAFCENKTNTVNDCTGCFSDWMGEFKKRNKEKTSKGENEQPPSIIV